MWVMPRRPSPNVGGQTVFALRGEMDSLFQFREMFQQEVVQIFFLEQLCKQLVLIAISISVPWIME